MYDSGNLYLCCSSEAYDLSLRGLGSFKAELKISGSQKRNVSLTYTAPAKPAATGDTGDTVYVELKGFVSRSLKIPVASSEGIRLHPYRVIEVAIPFQELLETYTAEDLAGLSFELKATLKAMPKREGMRRDDPSRERVGGRGMGGPGGGRMGRGDGGGRRGAPDGVGSTTLPVLTIKQKFHL
jgi:hypothetical protein